MGIIYGYGAGGSLLWRLSDKVYDCVRGCYASSKRAHSTDHHMQCCEWIVESALIRQLASTCRYEDEGRIKSVLFCYQSAYISAGDVVMGCCDNLKAEIRLRQL